MNIMPCPSVPGVRALRHISRNTTKSLPIVRSQDFCLFSCKKLIFPQGSFEDLVRHGLHALRETLQQDKELNVNNTSIGIIGPKSEHEKSETPGGAFRILENEAVEPFLQTMRSKEDLKEEDRREAEAKRAADAEAKAAAADDDVQMSG